jgi:hypothetical protein
LTVLLVVCAAACTDQSVTKPATTIGAESTTAGTAPARPTTSESIPADTLPTTIVTTGSSPTTTVPAIAMTVPLDQRVLAGAASNSIMPTVDGARGYLDHAPGWSDLDPNDIGVFVPKFDAGRVDVGNGSSDGSWVHDDLRTTALALRLGDRIVILATADVYMIFGVDAAEIERRTRALLPREIDAITQIVISSTHNHHGPDTAFSINDKWYDSMANQLADAMVRAVSNMQPATVEVASGEHRFGQADARDPLIVDPRLNVLRVAAVDDGATIATVVQWASHPETTLGWDPPGDRSAECAIKAWAADDCSANGRYFTADYPGILREQLRTELGGEVLYFNGALGSQVGPGHADVWQIDARHPIGDGVTAPPGAQPVKGATDLRTRNLARTLAIGSALTTKVLSLLRSAEPVPVQELVWKQQSFFTRLTNIGFRVLMAEGDVGWQHATVYRCSGKPFTDRTCVDDGGALEDDALLTPLVDSRIRAGDVIKTQVSFVGLGDVGFLFMPGELPPELVIGLPDDFTTNIKAYYDEPTLHATGAGYAIPGALLDLVPTRVTFTVGLGGDELGYFVPIGEVRLKCLDLALPAGGGWTCQRLFDQGYLVSPDAVAGPICRQLWDDPASVTDHGQVAALTAVCRYGQALGRELGEPAGHYEETNSAGWDLVDDLWSATEQLFAR